MKTWFIDKYHADLWAWIVNCYEDKGARRHETCEGCKDKEACDRIWEAVTK